MITAFSTVGLASMKHGQSDDIGGFGTPWQLTILIRGEHLHASAHECLPGTIQYPSQVQKRILHYATENAKGKECITLINGVMLHK